MAKEVHEPDSTNPCEQLIGWNREDERAKLDLLAAKLATFPQDVFGKSTRSITEPLSQFLTVMNRRHGRLIRLQELCEEQDGGYYQTQTQAECCRISDSSNWYTYSSPRSDRRSGIIIPAGSCVDMLGQIQIPYSQLPTDYYYIQYIDQAEMAHNVWILQEAIHDISQCGSVPTLGCIGYIVGGNRVLLRQGPGMIFEAVLDQFFGIGSNLVVVKELVKSVPFRLDPKCGDWYFIEVDKENPGGEVPIASSERETVSGWVPVEFVTQIMPSGCSFPVMSYAAWSEEIPEEAENHGEIMTALDFICTGVLSASSFWVDRFWYEKAALSDGVSLAYLAQNLLGDDPNYSDVGEGIFAGLTPPEVLDQRGLEQWQTARGQTLYSLRTGQILQPTRTVIPPEIVQLAAIVAYHESSDGQFSADFAYTMAWVVFNYTEAVGFGNSDIYNSIVQHWTPNTQGLACSYYCNNTCTNCSCSNCSDCPWELTVMLDGSRVVRIQGVDICAIRWKYSAIPEDFRGAASQAANDYYAGLPDPTNGATEAIKVVSTVVPAGGSIAASWETHMANLCQYYREQTPAGRINAVSSFVRTQSSTVSIEAVQLSETMQPPLIGPEENPYDARDDRESRCPQLSDYFGA